MMKCVRVYAVCYIVVRMGWEGAYRELGVRLKTMRVFIKTTSGKSFELDVDVREPVSAVKQSIAAREGVPSTQQRLIYRGRVLKDDATLESYGACCEHNTVYNTLN